MRHDSETSAIFQSRERQSLGLGIAAAVLCAIGAALDRPQFVRSYLVAYLFWWQIAVGCLAFAFLHQLVHGTWGLMTVRLFEAGGGTLPILAILFLPIALNLGLLYPWTGWTAANVDVELRHKARYLNESAFLWRSVIYFAIWIVVAVLLTRLTSRRDRAPGRRLTAVIRRLSAFGLVLVSLTVTFASIDWMMSLEPKWYSTIYGALVALSAMLASFSLVMLMVSRLAYRPPLSTIASAKVFNDLGSLLLGWVILWTYIAFSQYLITYSGNMVHEITWYLRRNQNGWEWLALALGVFQFAVPFLLLLSKTRKEDSRALGRVSLGLLCLGYVNVLWMVAPSFGSVPEAPERPITWTLTLPPLHWLDLVCPIAIGGIWMAVFLRLARRRPLLPVSDPAWENLEVHEKEKQNVSG